MGKAWVLWLALLAGCHAARPLERPPPLQPEAEGTDAGPVCPATRVEALGTDFFADISDASGIRAENFVANPATPIPRNDHARVAFADLNGDGRDDVVAHNLWPNVRAGIPFEHLVYLNDGDGTFTHFSDASGLRAVQAGFFAFGDLDNDGDQDCFAGLDFQVPGQTHQILLNDGQGHFSRVERSGVEALAPIAANAVFADFDADARLDLFVGMGGTTAMGGDALLLGNGDGTFRAPAAGMAGNTEQQTNGSVTCDYDNDGDLDIVVSTYGVSVNRGLNKLFENDGAAGFRNVASARRFDAQPTGNYYLSETGYGTNAEPGVSAYIGSNGFGVDCADVNNDGLMDIFQTAISHPVAEDYSRMWSDPSQLLINQGQEMAYELRNEFLQRGLPYNEGDVDGAAVDFDNDGRLDLSISRDRKYEGRYTLPEQKGWFGLMHQNPDGTFRSVGLESGINDPSEALWRMKAAGNHGWADIDLDGDLDLLVGGSDQGGGRPNFLFRNDIGSRNAWLAVRVQGDGLNVNRDGIGTRVTLVYLHRRLVREVRSSRGTYNSSDTRTLHFGLGDFGCGFRVEVHWPDGTEATFPAGRLALNRRVTIRYPDVVD